MPRNYEIQVTKDGHRGNATAFLLEDAVQIAQVSRGANISENGRRYCQDVKFKWFSEKAKARFSDFSDSLSATETVEALGFPYPFK